jgi:twinkle protein
MLEAQMLEASDWVNSHFMFLSVDEEAPTVQSLLDRFRIAIKRNGVKVCVADPFNFIRFPSSTREGPDTEAINRMLAEFKSFAMQYNVAFFLVAHPHKPMGQSRDWVPGGYSIAGSANFFNRADVGLTVHRDEYSSKLICWKARFSHIATPGEAYLSYDQSTGLFKEVEGHPEF